MQAPPSERIRQRLASAEQAQAELRRRAEQARERGDMQRYWALAAPRNLADLALLAGDELQATTLYRQAAQYYRERRAWAVEHGHHLPPLFGEASSFLMAGFLEEAQAALRALMVDEPPLRATLVGIALMGTGAVEEGREVLQRRAAALQETGRRDGPTSHQQSEIAFWLGDLAQARASSEYALQHWPAPGPPPPVFALHALFEALALPDDPELAVRADAALQTSVQWAYDDDFLKEAIDAREYRALLAGHRLNTTPQHPPRIRGLTMAWDT